MASMVKGSYVPTTPARVNPSRRREQLGIRDDQPLEIFETPDVAGCEQTADSALEEARQVCSSYCVLILIAAKFKYSLALLANFFWAPKFRICVDYYRIIFLSQ
jgi:hypothetical protein